MWEHLTNKPLICIRNISVICFSANLPPFDSKNPIQLFFLLTFPNSWWLWPLITDMRAQLGSDDALTQKYSIPKYNPKILNSILKNYKLTITALTSASGKFRDENLLPARWIFSKFLLLAATLRFNIKVICPIYWGCNLLMRRSRLWPATGTQGHLVGALVFQRLWRKTFSKIWMRSQYHCVNTLQNKRPVNKITYSVQYTLQTEISFRECILLKKLKNVEEPRSFISKTAVR